VPSTSPTTRSRTDEDPAVLAVRSLARLSRVLERASGELSLAHYRVLVAVADGDKRASRVAARLALGRPTISAAVDALCRRGLLLRLDVEGDGRATALSVTPAGRATLARVEADMSERLDEICTHTPDAPSVLDALARLGRAMDEVRAERTR
jgi:DNA-binding MarR family transcriptional regulator